MYFVNAGIPGRVGKLTPNQVVSRRTWATDTPDSQPGSHSTLSGLTRIRQKRQHGTTITLVNPMEPMHENGMNQWGDSLENPSQCCHDCSPQKVITY